MMLIDLLAALDGSSIRLTLDTAGQLMATGSTRQIAALAPELSRHRQILTAALVARRTGHLLAFCATCGEPTLTAAKTPAGKARGNWPRCRMTPGCGGYTQHRSPTSRHVPRPEDLDAMRDCPAPPAQSQPKRKA